MTGEILEGLNCPVCGGKVVNDGFDDWNNLERHAHCEDCDWNGTESGCEEEEDHDIL